MADVSRRRGCPLAGSAGVTSAAALPGRARWGGGLVSLPPPPPPPRPWSRSPQPRRYVWGPPRRRSAAGSGTGLPAVVPPAPGPLSGRGAQRRLLTGRRRRVVRGQSRVLSCPLPPVVSPRRAGSPAVPVPERRWFPGVRAVRGSGRLHVTAGTHRAFARRYEPLRALGLRTAFALKVLDAQCFPCL